MAKIAHVPNTPRWFLRNARAPQCLVDAPALAADREGLSLIDVLVADGKIDGIVPSGVVDDADTPVLDLGGGMVIPCFVDAHVHLDKAHIWPRASNPDGTFMRALETVSQDRIANWTANDVRARMQFGLRCAYAHGTCALRTHIDSLDAQTRISWPIFAELREAWRGRVDMQASPLFGIERTADEAHMRDVEDMVVEFGGAMGAVTYMVPELQSGLDRLFRIACAKGLDLDFHVDETKDISALSLRVIAETALRFEFPGRILAGHCCSLSLQDSDEAKRTIDLVARAGIAVVSLPMCNMYLQDREPLRTPRWRGVTALHELKAAGVDVLVASDNTRDPFYAYGDLDMLEVWREATRIIHLDHSAADWAKAIAATPADILRLPGHGRLTPGSSANFVVFRARSYTELFARPQTDRAVIRGGQTIAADHPDYRELDHLGQIHEASI